MASRLRPTVDEDPASGPSTARFDEASSDPPNCPPPALPPIPLPRALPPAPASRSPSLIRGRSLKLPPFQAEYAFDYFVQAEAFFRIHHVVDEISKYTHLVAALPTSVTRFV